MAKLSRFSPIITTASLHNEALLKSLGATHVLDRSLPRAELAAEVRKITGDAPVEYAYDAISHPDTQALAYEVLAPGGALVIVLEDSIPEEEKKKKNMTGGGAPTKIVRAFGSVQVPENRRFGVELYSRLTEWLEKGVIVVSPFRTRTCGAVCVGADCVTRRLAEPGGGAPEWSGGHPRGSRQIAGRQGQRKEAHCSPSGDRMRPSCMSTSQDSCSSGCMYYYWRNVNKLRTTGSARSHSSSRQHVVGCFTNGDRD